MAKTQSSVKRFFRTFSLLIVLGTMATSAAGLVFFYFLTLGLPPVSNLKSYQHPHATEVFSDDGVKVGEFTNERRYPVHFEAIPKMVLHAFLAAEDSKFYEHHGIDLNSIARAFWSNITRGRFAQGGSTITQQVARALLLETKKKEITRKLREMILAYRMERELSKDEILSLYLSEIYLGHGSYGIGAAARNYFNKKVENLTVAEAAILAGLPQRPNDWNPFHNPDLAKKRQGYVLRRMVDDRYLNDAESEAAFNETIRLYPVEDLNNSAAPYFVEYVRQYLMNKYGSEEVLSQGYRVYTTVRYDFQKAAEKALDKGLREVDKRLGWRGIITTLPDEQQRQDFRASVHAQVIDDLRPARLLTADAGRKGTKILEVDLKPFLEKATPYVGQTPVAEGKYYRAVISEVDDAKARAMVKVGLTEATLPFAGLSWVKVEDKPVTKVSQVLKMGDVVHVRVDKTDKRSGLVQVSLDQEPEVSGGFLSYDVKDGFVRAMVGGSDFTKSKFNVALQAKRQVGSTFKPLIYAAAIDKGFSPASLVTDSPIVFKYEGKLDADAGPAQGEDWKPHNFGGKFEGDIPLRLALIRSMNIPTVKLLSEITVDYGIQYARTLGITASLPRDLTIGLGSWSTSLEEIMRAYAIFPRLGKPIVLNYIRKVEDPTGKVVEELPAMQTQNEEGHNKIMADLTQDSNTLVISPQTAYVMTDMLKGVVREGTGTGAAIASNVAGKTGTSNDNRDAWFVGYTPQLMAGVWVGFMKDKALDPRETGGKASTPIWAEYVKSVMAQYPPGDFPIPEDIVFSYIDRFTGKPAGPDNSHRVRVAFKVGSVPDATASNIPRVGEPGVRQTTGTELSPAAPAAPGAAPGENDAPELPRPDDEDTGDFQRQGYE